MAITILALLGTIGAGVASAAGAVGGAVAGAAGAVAGGLGAAAGAVGSGLGAVGGALGGAAGTVGSALGSAAGGIGSALGSAGSAIGGAAGSIGSGIGSAASSTGSALASGASSLGSGLSSAAGSVGNALGGAAQGIGQGVQGAAQGLQGAVQGAGQTLQGAAQSVGQGLQSAAQGVGNVAEGAVQGLGDVASSVGQGIGDAASSVGQGLQEVGGQALDLAQSAGSTIQDLGGQALEGAQNLGGEVKDLAGQGFDKVKSVGSNLLGSGSDSGGNAEPNRGAFLRELDAEQAQGGGFLNSVGSYLKENTTAGRIYDAVKNPESFEAGDAVDLVKGLGGGQRQQQQGGSAAAAPPAPDYTSSLGSRLLTAYLGPDSETLSPTQRKLGLARGIIGGLRGGWAGYHGQMGSENALSAANDYTERTVEGNRTRAFRAENEAILADPNATPYERQRAQYQLQTGNPLAPLAPKEPRRPRQPYKEVEYDAETDTETVWRVEEDGTRTQIGDARPANRVKKEKAKRGERLTATMRATNAEIDDDRDWWDALPEDEKRKLAKRGARDAATQQRMKNITKSKRGGYDPRRNEILNELEEYKKPKPSDLDVGDRNQWLRDAIEWAEGLVGRRPANAGPPPQLDKGSHYRNRDAGTVTVFE